jgi:hypothetical protein
MVFSTFRKRDVMGKMKNGIFYLSEMEILPWLVNGLIRHPGKSIFYLSYVTSWEKRYFLPFRILKNLPWLLDGLIRHPKNVTSWEKGIFYLSKMEILPWLVDG